MYTGVNGLNRVLRRINIDGGGDFSDLSKNEDFVLTAINTLIGRREAICEASIGRLINNSRGEKIINVRVTIGCLIKRGILTT